MSILSDNLCKALENVQTELKADHILEKLKKIVERQIREIKRSKKVELVLDETSSRIKSLPSFKEKLARKNYLKDWKLNDHSTLGDCQKAIRENLSDLIGIRVNCFFKDDEESIYKYFLEKLESLDQASKKNPNIGRSWLLLPKGYKDDVKKLKTGDSLYKVSCEYRYKKSANSSQSCFIELQIKCMTHNLWGEVEHEISYKAKQYDYAFQSKNRQIQDIYTSLKASDSQLRTLYTSQEYQKQDLLNSLFFLYTRDDVERILDGKNSSQLYTWFFQIFKKDENLVTNYVKKQLVPEISFSKQSLCIDKNDKILNFFVKHVILSNFLGKFNDLSAIAELLYENVNEDEICWLIGYEIINQIRVEDRDSAPSSITSILEEIEDEEDEDGDGGSLFSNDENSNEEDQTYSTIPYLGCAKIQKTIYERINNQVESYLTKNDKNVLLQCVDFLCYVISGGLKDV